MSKLKTSEIRKMGSGERHKRISEMKMELIKARANASKSGNAKIREAKKVIARILTINKSLEGELKNKEQNGSLASKKTVLKMEKERNT
ncbi:MAG: 50S ribosomal protein L29 [Nanoarchaeota archaeon]